MNKIHHLFYLHRMVVKRNAYTEKCYRNGKKPILPTSSLHSFVPFSQPEISTDCNNYKWKNHFHEMNGDVGMAGWK